LEEHTLLRGLIHILPLISNINSIQIYSSDIDLFHMVYNNNNANDDSQSHESQLLLKEMMAQARILLINWKSLLFCSWFFLILPLHRNPDHSSWEDKIDWCCFWLNIPRNDGKPRMLKSDDSIYEQTDCAFFIERIKKAYFYFIKKSREF
jgi:hypothetical protein